MCNAVCKRLLGASRACDSLGHGCSSFDYSAGTHHIMRSLSRSSATFQCCWVVATARSVYRAQLEEPTKRHK